MWLGRQTCLMIRVWLERERPLTETILLPASSLGRGLPLKLSTHQKLPFKGRSAFETKACYRSVSGRPGAYDHPANRSKVGVRDRSYASAGQGSGVKAATRDKAQQLYC